MGRSHHVSAAFAKDFDAFLDVGFEFFIGAVRHQVLLVDRTPECEHIAVFILDLLRRVQRNSGLNRVEHVEAALFDHRHQCAYGAVAVQNHYQIRFFGLQRVNHLFVIRQ